MKTHEELRRLSNSCIQRADVMKKARVAWEELAIEGLGETPMELMSSAAEITVERLQRFSDDMEPWFRTRLYEQAVTCFVEAGRFRDALAVSWAWETESPSEYRAACELHGTSWNFLKSSGYLRWRNKYAQTHTVPKYLPLPEFRR